jgi:hypothetical protein
MNDAARLRALKQIADMLSDRDIARLSKAQAQKARTEALLRALDHSSQPADLDPAAVALVVERYGLWTSNRRIVLNQQLARDTASWIIARDAAQKAFGRAQVVQSLLGKK